MTAKAVASAGGRALCGLLLAVFGAGCGDEGVVLDPSSVETADLGVFAIDAEGVTEDVEVVMPEDAVSLTLVATQAASREILFGITAPDGTTLTRGVNRCTSVDSPLRVLTRPSTAVAMMPGTEVAPAVGSYRVRLRTALAYAECAGPPLPGPGPVALRALWKKVPMAEGKQGPLRGQRLAVNVFLVGNVKRNPLLDGGLAHMRGLFARAGLEVAPPTIIELRDYEAARYARIHLDSESLDMRMLLRRSAEAPEDGVNIFVVDEITAGAGFTIFGVAAGIPGTSERGSERSGVLASNVILDSRMFDERFVGRVLAHEIGHFLGLYHTTEASGAHDQIADTPACPGYGYQAPTRKNCLAADGNNLMFWEGDTFGDKEIAASGSLTPGQSFVMLRSAATH